MKRTMLWLLLLMVLPVGATQVEDPVGLEQLRKTAESGNVEAMLELGILYEYGFKMPDNKPPALVWYRLAAEAGNAKAGARHDALKGSMSGKEIEEANKLYTELSATIRKPAPRAETPLPAAPGPAEEPPKTQTAPEEPAKQATPSPAAQ